MKVKNTIKYALTDKTKTIQGHTLHQIVALRDIKPLSVYKGMRGGYIEKEANLSHSGNCWVDDDAQVFENARINGDAYVKDNAQIYGSAVLDGNVRVRGMSAVYEHARLTDHAEVCDRAPYIRACVPAELCICKRRLQNIWKRENVWQNGREIQCCHMWRRIVI